MAPPATAANGMPKPAPIPAFSWFDDRQESSEVATTEVVAVTGGAPLAAGVEFDCRLAFVSPAPRLLVSFNHPGASWKWL